MECNTGCISQDECSANTKIIITAIFLAFIGFCGGQMCYIVSLSKKLNNVTENTQPCDSRSLMETPPPYQRVENI